MGRLAQLKRNTGWRGVLQTGAVLTAFVAVAVVMAAVEGQVAWSDPDVVRLD